ncbi:DUF4126 family protein [Paraburkholderia sp. IMGN_8]|uniref:DUF4126 family protein n=1 Tax=Paraburkholderia sp. IMGN_8 TaxID=3136564 RepID=UPI00310109AD
MSIYLIALIIGIVAGLRTFIAPAAISWLAYTNPSHYLGTWASFMSSVWAVGIFSILVIVEFVTDQLPKTPSRKVPMQFIPRLVSGGFCGAVLGASSGNLIGCAVTGVVGAAIGTFSGFEYRSRLAKLFGGRDRPAAVIEDLTALVIAYVAVFII